MKTKYSISSIYKDILQDKLILAYIWCSKELTPNKLIKLDRIFMQNEINKYIDFRHNITKDSYFNFDYMASLGHSMLIDERVVN